MRVYPDSAYIQLEFEKIKSLLAEHCQAEYARNKAQQLRIHTQKEFIDTELRQSHEYSQLIKNGIYFPNDYVLNLAGELKLLGIPGAVLNGEQLMQIRKLAESMEKIFRWFDNERRTAYTALARLISDTYYEKAIMSMIDEVLDEDAQVKDNASAELKSIRSDLYRKRNELRRLFEKIVARLNRQGYLAEMKRVS
jgi:DNA mismatch repair protein MutS2